MFAVQITLILNFVLCKITEGNSSMKLIIRSFVLACEVFSLCLGLKHTETQNGQNLKTIREISSKFCRQYYPAIINIIIFY